MTFAIAEVFSRAFLVLLKNLRGSEDLLGLIGCEAYAC